MDLPLLYTGNNLAGAEARDDPVPGLRLRRVLEGLLGRLEPRDRIAAPEDRDGRERLERRRRLAEARLGVLDPAPRVGPEDRREVVHPLADDLGQVRQSGIQP